MADVKKTYYIVDANGNVLCVDGAFHEDETFGKRRSYKRLSAAKENAKLWNRYKRCRVFVMDNEGNEIYLNN